MKQIPIFLAGIILGAASLAGAAVECLDWSLAPSRPHLTAAVTGNACRVAGDLVYAAGANFTVVDASIQDQPRVLSSLALPAAATDLALAGPVAYAACGAAGVVELDISQPDAPRIARRYDPVDPITKVVVVRDIIVAMDSGSRIHLLASGAGGALAAMAVHPMPAPVLSACAAGPYLVVAESSRLKIVKLDDIRNPRVVGEVMPGQEYLSAVSVCASGSSVYLVGGWMAWGEYVTSWQGFIGRYEIGASGALTKGAELVDLPDAFDDVAAAPDRLVTVSDDGLDTQLRHAGNLSLSARPEMRGVSVDTDGYLVAAIGASGLSTLRLPGEIPRPEPAFGSLDAVSGLGFDGVATGAAWKWPYALFTTSSYYYNGHLNGYANLSVAYAVARGDDAREMVVTATGGFSDSSGSGGLDEDPCGLAWIQFRRVNDRLVLVSWGDSCSQVHRLYDAVDGRLIGSIPNSCLEPGGIGSDLTGDRLWLYGSGGWRSFDLGSATPLVALPAVAFRRPGWKSGPDSSLLVVLDSTARELDTYDMSDASAVVFGATLPLPFTGYFRGGYWLGRVFVALSSDAVTTIDCTDPARPFVVATRPVETGKGTPDLLADGPRAVLRYYWTTQSPWAGHLALQVFDVDAAGVLTMHPSAEIGGSTWSGIVNGDVLYADGETGISAYDLADPSRPRLLGVTARGTGGAARAGDFVASGTLLTPRDCRDLRPPRSIVIDVLPTLKPGSSSGYSGPALVPVTVRSSAGFDPGLIDAATVRFGPAGAMPVPEPGPAGKSSRRAGDAPIGDVTFWFRLADAGLGLDAGEACLSGATFDGQEVLGCALLDGGQPATEPGPGIEVAAWPNPFNPRTTLEFSVDSRGPCELAIHNLKGQRVRLLAQDMFAPGRHAVTWDGCDDRGVGMASGVYFAHVRCGGVAATQRLVLLR